jgi:hypothetical protein
MNDCLAKNSFTLFIITNDLRQKKGLKVHTFGAFSANRISYNAPNTFS